MREEKEMGTTTAADRGSDMTGDPRLEGAASTAAPDMLALLDRCEWFLREMPALPPVGAELLEDICRIRSKATGAKP